MFLTTAITVGCLFPFHFYYTLNHWLATIESDTTIDYPYHWHATHALNHCLHSTPGNTNLHLHSTTDMLTMKTQQTTCNHWLATIESDTTIDYPYHWQATHALYHCLLATTGHINLCLHSTIAYTESVCIHSLHLTIGYTQPLHTLKKFTLNHWLHTTIVYTTIGYTQPLQTLKKFAFIVYT